MWVFPVCQVLPVLLWYYLLENACFFSENGIYYSKNLVYKVNYFVGASMANDYQLQEELLYAWMQMSVCIRGNRILSDLSFNEVMLCGTLLRRTEIGSPPATATELCEEMRLLKSQINHILTTLEKKGLLERIRSEADKRVIHVYLTEKGRQCYQQEHQRVMELMEQVCLQLGEDDARQLSALITRATGLVTNLTER